MRVIMLVDAEWEALWPLTREDFPRPFVPLAGPGAREGGPNTPRTTTSLFEQNLRLVARLAPSVFQILVHKEARFLASGFLKAAYAARNQTQERDLEKSASSPARFTDGPLYVVEDVRHRTWAVQKLLTQSVPVLPDRDPQGAEAARESEVVALIACDFLLTDEAQFLQTFQHAVTMAQGGMPAAFLENSVLLARELDWRASASFVPDETPGIPPGNNAGGGTSGTAEAADFVWLRAPLAELPSGTESGWPPFSATPMETAETTREASCGLTKIVNLASLARFSQPSSSEGASREEKTAGSVFIGPYGGPFVHLVGGVRDLALITTPDVIVAMPYGSEGPTEADLAALRQEHPRLLAESRRSYRPWGYYTDLEEGPGFRVKRLVVTPGASLSLQYHHHRAEHWTVVEGTAYVTVGDKSWTAAVNESIYIPKLAPHRLENKSSEVMQIIEVQCGSYLGEDDIVRLEDKYARVET